MSADLRHLAPGKRRSKHVSAQRTRHTVARGVPERSSKRKTATQNGSVKARTTARSGRGAKVRANSPQKQLAGKVVRRLRADYPDATCALRYASPFQLLVATILSAQCTDERVNIVTADLFRRYPFPEDFARVPLKTLEKAIQSTGFFRNKAKNIKACSQELVEHYEGQVPRDLDDLVALPGIGRKTANVVLGTAFRIATGVVVDTHVGRLSRRLGLSNETNAEKVEQDLMQILPQKEWIDFSHRMIHHGRRICTARKPHCDDCSMTKFCQKNGV